MHKAWNQICTFLLWEPHCEIFHIQSSDIFLSRKTYEDLNEKLLRNKENQWKPKDNI